jgi:galactokinase
LRICPGYQGIKNMKRIRVSVPGRICLFGEHQDYLHLPVITTAINLRVAISGSSRSERTIEIDLPDIDSQEVFALPQAGEEIPYHRERDYFRSVYNVLLRQGLQPDHGFRCDVHGTIPINSGTSSSSALVIAWAKFLIENSLQLKSTFSQPADIARVGHLAEVAEFGEPGGMMDHYATAIGGVLFIDFTEGVHYQPLKNQLGSFVLGDSLEPKNTKDILARVKFGVLDAIKKIRQVEPDFNLIAFNSEDVERFAPVITPAQKEVLIGAFLNRDITRLAKNYFQSERFDHTEFGRLLTRHQEILNNRLRISTAKIERMLDAASAAGALGGKINGSGGGGCMFAYAPENPHKVARAIETAGGKAYVIKVDSGMKVES